MSAMRDAARNAIPGSKVEPIRAVRWGNHGSLVSKALLPWFMMRMATLSTMLSWFLLVVQCQVSLRTTKIVTWVTFRCRGMPTYAQVFVSILWAFRRDVVCRQLSLSAPDKAGNVFEFALRGLDALK